MRLVDGLLAAKEPEREGLLELASRAAGAEGRTGGAKRRMPAEQLVADAFAMKRLSARLHARLLERPLASFGADAAALAARELQELNTALVSLCATLERRLAAGQEVGS